MGNRRKKTLPDYESKRLGEANMLYALGSSKEAIEILEVLAMQYPGVSEIYKTMGVIYESEQDVERAMYAYHKTVALRKGDDDAWYKLAKLYEQLGDYSNCFQCIHACVVISPDRLDAQYLKGVCAYQLGRHRKALGTLNRARKRYPYDLRVVKEVIRVARELEEEEEAIIAGREYVDIILDPVHPQGYIEQSLHEGGMNVDEMVAFFSQYSEMLIEAGEYEQCIGLFQRVEGMGGRVPIPDELIILHGIALGYVGRFERVLQIAREVVMGRRGGERVYVPFVRMLIGLGEARLGVEILEGMRDSSVSFYEVYAMGLRQVGRVDEAKLCYEKILQLDESNATAMNGMLEMHLENRDFEAASCMSHAVMQSKVAVSYQGIPMILHSLRTLVVNEHIEGFRKEFAGYFSRPTEAIMNWMKVNSHLGYILGLCGALVKMGAYEAMCEMVDMVLMYRKRKQVVDNVSLHYLCAVGYYYSGKEEKSYQHLRKIMYVKPLSPALWYIFLRITEKEGSFGSNQNRKFVNRMQHQYGEERVIWYISGHYASIAGRKAEALEWYEKVLFEGPQLDPVLYLSASISAMMCFKKGGESVHYIKALSYMQSYQKQSPKDGYYNMGRLFHLVGLFTCALRCYEESIRIGEVCRFACGHNMAMIYQAIGRPLVAISKRQQYCIYALGGIEAAKNAF